jgi:hypothetical protein
MKGDAPDPQLHSHVVIKSAIREDGRLVAVASRPVFRSAREIGAYYGSALAHEFAAVLGALGRHSEALELKIRLLDDIERLFGADNPRTMTVLQGLIVTLSSLDREEDVLPLKVRVISDRERRLSGVLGTDYPDTVVARGDLATMRAAFDASQAK